VTGPSSGRDQAGAIDGPDSFADHFKVDGRTIERLETYVRLLRQWQAKINLVAPSTVDDVWHRHFADSAQLFRHAPDEATDWADLGSGAGFPGLVLAILLAERDDTGPRARMRLYESDRRKAAFLREVARQTSVAVDIVPERIELSSTHANFCSVNVITARALAPLHRLLGYALPFFAPGTVALFAKGRGVEDEIEAAREAWTFKVRLENSLTDPEGRVAVIEDLAANA